MKKLFFVLLVFIISTSFCPTSEMIFLNSRSGFYITVEDFTDRTNHEYIVETKDSVNDIFTHFFNAELELGEVDRPITIFNGKHNFYIARVTVFENSDGKKTFRHLKYENVYTKRAKLKPVTM
jgi:hypothetical protein